MFKNFRCLFLFAIPITCLCTLIWFDNSYFFFMQICRKRKIINPLVTKKRILPKILYIKKYINRKRRLNYKENNEQINKQRRERHGHSFANVIDSQGEPTKFQIISDIMRRSNRRSQFLSSMPTYSDNCNERLIEIIEPFVNHTSGERLSNHGTEV